MSDNSPNDPIINEFIDKLTGNLEQLPNVNAFIEQMTEQLKRVPSVNSLIQQMNEQFKSDPNIDSIMQQLDEQLGTNRCSDCKCEHIDSTITCDTNNNKIQNNTNINQADDNISAYTVEILSDISSVDSDHESKFEKSCYSIGLTIYVFFGTKYPEYKAQLNNTLSDDEYTDFIKGIGYYANELIKQAKPNQNIFSTVIRHMIDTLKE